MRPDKPNKDKVWRMCMCILLAGLFGIAVPASSQSLPVDLQSAAEEEAARSVEIPGEPTEENEVGLNGFLQELADLREEPLNLNTASRDDLARLLLLSDLQVFNLVAYRETYGSMVTIFELQAIDGFDFRTIGQILPFVFVGKETTGYRIKPRHIATFGKHQIILRVQRVLEQRAGYDLPVDSVIISNPGNHYLGSPERIFLRYGFSFRNRIRFGFTVEKDPGELILPSQISKSLLAQTSGRGMHGPDFFSSHLFLSRTGILKSFVAGDYQLQFGQGLTFCSGRGFGGTGDYTRVRRINEGIRPHTGSEENLFLRGIAFTLEKRNLQATFFYSGKPADGTLVMDTAAGDPGIKVRQDHTGYHRTVRELNKKNTFRIRTGGINASYRTRRFRIGLTAFRTRYEFPLNNTSGLYSKFHLSDRDHLIAGIDYHYLARGFSFFGEAAMGGNGSVAQVHGVTASLHPAFSISLVYRDYPRDYQNPFSNPFTASNSYNERGIYSGMRIQLPGGFDVRGSLDVYSFPWLKYRADRPTRGKDFDVSVEKNVAGLFSLMFRVKTREYQRNKSGADAFVSPLQNNRWLNYRFQVSYELSESISMRNRVDVVRHYQESDKVLTGFMIFHDIRWKERKERLVIDLRYALFDTDTYDQRIYVYEQDVLYAFSVPAYYDKGAKGIIVAKIKPAKWISLGLRLTRTWYLNKQVIGSGTEEITGNALTEVKAQVVVKIR